MIGTTRQVRVWAYGSAVDLRKVLMAWRLWWEAVLAKIPCRGICFCSSTGAGTLQVPARVASGRTGRAGFSAAFRKCVAPFLAGPGGTPGAPFGGAAGSDRAGAEPVPVETFSFSGASALQAPATVG